MGRLDPATGEFKRFDLPAGAVRALGARAAVLDSAGVAYLHQTHEGST